MISEVIFEFLREKGKTSKLKELSLSHPPSPPWDPSPNGALGLLSSSFLLMWILQFSIISSSPLTVGSRLWTKYSISVLTVPCFFISYLCMHLLLALYSFQHLEFLQFFILLFYSLHLLEMFYCSLSADSWELQSPVSGDRLGPISCTLLLGPVQFPRRVSTIILLLPFIQLLLWCNQW